jgi:CRISPR-associated endonuclease/helicase Cas3
MVREMATIKWSEDNYRAFFRKLNQGFEPYDFQLDIARKLIAGSNLCLRAPTGAGKTAAVITPFLFNEWSPRPNRLIYALPLRTLAHSIYRTAREMMESAGYDQNLVTIQTGEQPDDPFFDLGKIIVATYDQVLSGLLDGPYGLPDKLHNINSAALANTMVVFDEFHLMEPQRAFLTGAAGLYLFRDLVQSVWMTATATSPLERVLTEALGAVRCGPDDEAMAMLPSVRGVERRLVWDPEPLSASVVPAHPTGRTILLVNTVGRAQALYHEIKESHPELTLTMAHSRFFRSHRRDREKKLNDLFGKGNKRPAVLIATQVIEAGVDISCDELHTELAPMNSLIQRAGRCARFEGESGTVHIHALPAEERSWLPYGTLREPEQTIAATQQLLEKSARRPTALSPTVAAQWVETVHKASDAAALGNGWQSHTRTVRERIYQSAIARQKTGVSDLIREPDTADIQVVLARSHNLPSRPRERESIGLSRYRVSRVLRDNRDASTPIGWVWKMGAEPGWETLSSDRQLAETYVVALSPEFAHYSQEFGLEEGFPGTEESPPRIEPPRPGYAPLRAESWEDHIQAVARTALKRLKNEDYQGWLGHRLQKRFGLDPAALAEATRACGLLHDLGKLQKGWQSWAAESQGLSRPGQPVKLPLAHTDFDAGSAAGRQECEGSITVHRPDHSAASAYLGVWLVGRLLSGVDQKIRTPLASACLAAVLSHHGGWLKSESAANSDLGIQPLWPGFTAAVDAVYGQGASQLLITGLNQPDRRHILFDLLNQTTSEEGFGRWWPLVAYLARTLRLADQVATKEGGRE